MRAEQALPEPGPQADGEQACAQGRDMCPQVDAALPAVAAPGRLRPGGPVRRGRAHPAPGVLLGGDTGEPASWGLCPCSRGPAGARTHRAPASSVAKGPVHHSRQGSSHQPQPGSCPSQNWGREKPPGQQPARSRAEVFPGGGTQSLSLSLSQFADGALASQLSLLLLERSDSLYQVPGYEAGVHRWVPPGGLRPSCGSMAQPWTGSLTPRALPLMATVPQLPQTPSPASALPRPLYGPFPAHPNPSCTEPSRTCVPLAEGPV